jgi:hypothetical protein
MASPRVPKFGMICRKPPISNTSCTAGCRPQAAKPRAAGAGRLGRLQQHPQPGAADETDAREIQHQALAGHHGKQPGSTAGTVAVSSRPSSAARFTPSTPESIIFIAYVSLMAAA